MKSRELKLRGRGADHTGRFAVYNHKKQLVWKGDAKTMDDLVPRCVDYADKTRGHVFLVDTRYGTQRTIMPRHRHDVKRLKRTSHLPNF